MYGEWSVKHAYTQTFLAHCAFQVQSWNKVKDLDRSLENVVNIFLVLYVKRTLSKGTTNVSNWHTSTVHVYREVPLPFPAFTCRTFPLWTWNKYRNIPLHEIYPVTKFEGLAACSTAMRDNTNANTVHTPLSKSSHTAVLEIHGKFK